uniref:Uncharacterized protein n=1 Tax=Chromera velia CCMP2878 TaxID=1169474 RepID=A0A0G4I2F4_9ALVE|eukprot:Cvel_10349.t1-p1 / transcript=Cvel_10349.t1 / gene=Cvel_10349 / organism=Chromera_velia_CCMP2878 / gene_product=hypothetical protein / transcript_product=hypothetical protein / location=Cvel_scaffold622:18383-24253(+) / protein_length=1316 / sequence_SO=supercontig / SO=protein_coding / is_pseudo=false
MLKGGYDDSSTGSLQQQQTNNTPSARPNNPPGPAPIFSSSRPSRGELQKKRETPSTSLKLPEPSTSSHTTPLVTAPLGTRPESALAAPTLEQTPPIFPPPLQSIAVSATPKSTEKPTGGSPDDASGPPSKPTENPESIDKPQHTHADKTKHSDKPKTAPPLTGLIRVEDYFKGLQCAQPNALGLASSRTGSLSGKFTPSLSTLVGGPLPLFRVEKTKRGRPIGSKKVHSDKDKRLGSSVNKSKGASNRTKTSPLNPQGPLPKKRPVGRPRKTPCPPTDRPIRPATDARLSSPTPSSPPPQVPSLPHLPEGATNSFEEDPGTHLKRETSKGPGTGMEFPSGGGPFNQVKGGRRRHSEAGVLKRSAKKSGGNMRTIKSNNSNNQFPSRTPGRRKTTTEQPLQSRQMPPPDPAFRLHHPLACHPRHIDMSKQTHNLPNKTDEFSAQQPPQSQQPQQQPPAEHGLLPGKLGAWGAHLWDSLPPAPSANFEDPGIAGRLTFGRSKRTGARPAYLLPSAPSFSLGRNQSPSSVPLRGRGEGGDVCRAMLNGDAEKLPPGTPLQICRPSQYGLTGNSLMTEWVSGRLQSIETQSTRESEEEGDGQSDPQSVSVSVSFKVPERGDTEFTQRFEWKRFVDTDVPCICPPEGTVRVRPPRLQMEEIFPGKLVTVLSRQSREGRGTLAERSDSAAVCDALICDVRIFLEGGGNQEGFVDLIYLSDGSLERHVPLFDLQHSLPMMASHDRTRHWWLHGEPLVTAECPMFPLVKVFVSSGGGDGRAETTQETHPEQVERVRPRCTLFDDSEEEEDYVDEAKNAEEGVHKEDEEEEDAPPLPPHFPISANSSFSSSSSVEIAAKIQSQTSHQPYTKVRPHSRGNCPQRWPSFQETVATRAEISNSQSTVTVTNGMWGEGEEDGEEGGGFSDSETSQIPDRCSNSNRVKEDSSSSCPQQERSDSPQSSRVLLLFSFPCDYYRTASPEERSELQASMQREIQTSTKQSIFPFDVNLDEGGKTEKEAEHQDHTDSRSHEAPTALSNLNFNHFGEDRREHTERQGGRDEVNVGPPSLSLLVSPPSSEAAPLSLPPWQEHSCFHSQNLMMPSSHEHAGRFGGPLSFPSSQFLKPPMHSQSLLQLQHHIGGLHGHTDDSRHAPPSPMQPPYSFGGMNFHPADADPCRERDRHDEHNPFACLPGSSPVHPFSVSPSRGGGESVSLPPPPPPPQSHGGADADRDDLMGVGPFGCLGEGGRFPSSSSFSNLPGGTMGGDGGIGFLPSGAGGAAEEGDMEGDLDFGRHDFPPHGVSLSGSLLNFEMGGGTMDGSGDFLMQ